MTRSVTRCPVTAARQMPSRRHVQAGDLLYSGYDGATISSPRAKSGVGTDHVHTGDAREEAEGPPGHQAHDFRIRIGRHADELAAGSDEEVARGGELVDEGDAVHWPMPQ